MLQTLLVNLKLHFREKAQLFWLFAFPIILATMFNGMFGKYRGKLRIAHG